MRHNPNQTNVTLHVLLMPLPRRQSHEDVRLHIKRYIEALAKILRNMEPVALPAPPAPAGQAAQVVHPVAANGYRHQGQGRGIKRTAALNGGGKKRGPMNGADADDAQVEQLGAALLQLAEEKKADPTNIFQQVFDLIDDGEMTIDTSEHDAFFALYNQNPRDVDALADAVTKMKERHEANKKSPQWLLAHDIRDLLTNVPKGFPLDILRLLSEIQAKAMDLDAATASSVLGALNENPLDIESIRQLLSDVAVAQGIPLNKRQTVDALLLVYNETVAQIEESSEKLKKGQMTEADWEGATNASRQRLQAVFNGYVDIDVDDDPEASTFIAMAERLMSEYALIDGSRAIPVNQRPQALLQSSKDLDGARVDFLDKSGYPRTLLMPGKYPKSWPQILYCLLRIAVYRVKMDLQHGEMPDAQDVNQLVAKLQQVKPNTAVRLTDVLAKQISKLLKGLLRKKKKEEKKETTSVVTFSDMIKYHEEITELAQKTIGDSTSGLDPKAGDAEHLKKAEPLYNDLFEKWRVFLSPLVPASAGPIARFFRDECIIHSFGKIRNGGQAYPQSEKFRDEATDRRKKFQAQSFASCEGGVWSLVKGHTSLEAVYLVWLIVVHVFLKKRNGYAKDDLLAATTWLAMTVPQRASDIGPAAIRQLVGWVGELNDGREVIRTLEDAFGEVQKGSAQAALNEFSEQIQAQKAYSPSSDDDEDDDMPLSDFFEVFGQFNLGEMKQAPAGPAAPAPVAPVAPVAIPPLHGARPPTPLCSSSTVYFTDSDWEQHAKYTEGMIQYDPDTYGKLTFDEAEIVLRPRDWVLVPATSNGGAPIPQIAFCDPIHGYYGTDLVVSPSVTTQRGGGGA